MQQPVFHNGTGPVKPALTRGELSQREVEQLMLAFTRGKTEVAEDDAIMLLNWANRMRTGAMLVDMVLAGDIIASVEGDRVKVTLPSQAVARE